MKITEFMDKIGNRSKCKGCGKEIWWIVHASGSVAPYTEEGLNHFINCPKAKDFRRKS